MKEIRGSVWIGEITSGDVAETLAIGRRIGSALGPYEMVGLIGPLGAGKTYLAKGIARGLGVSDDRQVCSPTFVLVNEYAGRVPVYHIDAYRLPDPGALLALGFEEICANGAVVMVEWADRMRTAMRGEILWIELSPCGETRRRLTLRTESATIAKRLRDVGIDRPAHRGDIDRASG